MCFKSFFILLNCVEEILINLDIKKMWKNFYLVLCVLFVFWRNWCVMFVMICYLIKFLKLCNFLKDD